MKKTSNNLLKIVYAFTIVLFSISKSNAQESYQKLVKLPILQGDYESYLTLMRINVAEGRKEDGNISLTLFGKDDANTTLYLFERFKDKAAWDAHQETVYARSIDGISPAATAKQMEEFELKEISEIPAEEIEEVSPEENTQNIIVMFETKPEKTTMFIEAMKSMILKARDAEGNLGFNIFQKKDEPNNFVVIERWKNPQVHQAHLESDYSIQLNKDLDGILAADPMQNSQVLKNLSE